MNVEKLIVEVFARKRFNEEFPGNHWLKQPEELKDIYRDIIWVEDVLGSPTQEGE